MEVLPNPFRKPTMIFWHWFWNTWPYLFYSIFWSVPTSKTGFLWMWNISWWTMFRSKAILTLSQPLTKCRKVTFCSMWERTNQKQTCKFWGLHNGIIEDSCLVDTFLQNVRTHSPKSAGSHPRSPKFPETDFFYDFSENEILRYKSILS